MERRLELAQGRGHLELREEGEWVVCRGVMPDDGQGLYKGWLEGRGGARVELGAFLPREGRLVLERRLARRGLEQKGVWPPVRAGAALRYAPGQAPRPPAPPPGWRWESDPARLMGEPLLARAAGRRRALCRREAEGFSLAYPFRPEEAFPLPPLFCFARVERLEGSWYALFPFRPGGCPRGPEGGAER